MTDERDRSGWPVSDALHIDSVAIRSGRSANGASLAAPLWATSVWEQSTLEEGRRMAGGTRAPAFYSRYGNPTVTAFEQAIAELEGAGAAMAFASGMGAISSVLFALCSPGDHVVCQRQIYSGTQLLLQGPAARMGIETTWVDATEPGAFAAAVRRGKTMLVIAETPANPALTLTDLDEIGAIKGPFTMVDSTFATPILQRPLQHGVDLVVHSATKAIGGHNDATLGVIVGERELVDDIWRYSVLHGATASPYDAHNALRGIRTLAVRQERACATAATLATHLAKHRGVNSVNYPGLESHPQYELARRQMRASGAMMSFDVGSGRDGARRFVESVRLARLATSLGGPETLVTSPPNTTHVGLTEDELAVAGIPPGLIRVSIGLEHPADLMADFDQALRAAAG